MVFITGISFVADLSGGTPTGKAFQCYANQSAGTFTVGPQFLNLLPATSETVIPGVGSLILVPGFVTISSVGKVAYGTASGLDSLTFTSSSSTAQSTIFR